MIICLSVLLIASRLPVNIYAGINRQEHVLFRIVHYLIAIDTTLSPLVYCYLNAGFQSFVKSVLCCRFDKKKRLSRASGTTTQGIIITLRPPSLSSQTSPSQSRKFSESSSDWPVQKKARTHHLRVKPRKLTQLHTSSPDSYEEPWQIQELSSGFYMG